MSTNHRPIECPAFFDIELRLDDVEIDAQLPIESDFPLRAEMGGPAPRVGARVITEHIREGGSAIRISTDNGVVRLEVRR